jgi:hypothetical protein
MTLTPTHMPMPVARTLVVLAILASAASQAFAQTRRPMPPARRPPAANRVFVSVDGAFHGARTFGDGFMFRRNAEDARVESRYNVTPGPALNVSVTAPLWRRFGVGGSVTRFSRTSLATVTASVPHPFFFDRLRTVDGTVEDVAHQELGVHLQARAVLPVGRRMQAMVFGGPSFFRLHQDVLGTVSWDETYPYDTAAFGRAEVEPVTASTLGFNVGGDVAYYFTRRVGVGVAGQYSGGTVTVPAPSGTVAITVGGPHIGGGLRLRF